MNQCFRFADSDAAAEKESEILTDDKGLYYYEIAGLPDHPSSSDEAEVVSRSQSKVSFSTAPIPVCP